MELLHSALSSVSLVIPVYNEEATVAEVVRRVYVVDLGAADREIIVCDDGFSDGTLTVIAQLRALYPERKRTPRPSTWERVQRCGWG